MKKINLLLLAFAVLINIACGNRPFDLSSVILGDDAKKYDFENKNIFLKDVSVVSGTEVTQYYADENKNMMYGNIPLDHTVGTRITVYKGKVVAFDTNAEEKYSLEFMDKILKKNGKPITFITDEANVNPKIAQQVFEKLKKITPNDVSWNPEDKNTFIYPYSFLWDDGKNYSILSISIENDGNIRNRYLSVTKEAYRNNIVYTLKYPAPKESPWYNYMK